MTPAPRRKPDPAVVAADPIAAAELELSATEPGNFTPGIPTRYTIPPHTRVAEIPARIIRARDIARMVRDEIALNPDIDLELAAGVIGLANCIETICEVIA